MCVARLLIYLGIWPNNNNHAAYLKYNLHNFIIVEKVVAAFVSQRSHPTHSPCFSTSLFLIPIADEQDNTPWVSRCFRYHMGANKCKEDINLDTGRRSRIDEVYILGICTWQPHCFAVDVRKQTYVWGLRSSNGKIWLERRKRRAQHGVSARNFW